MLYVLIVLLGVSLLLNLVQGRVLSDERREAQIERMRYDELCSLYRKTTEGGVDVNWWVRHDLVNQSRSYR
jgi:hypothetical protein